MSRFMHRIVVLVVISASVTFTAPASDAAPPAPQPVTLSCATGLSVQVLGNAQPTAAEGQALVLMRAIFAPGGGIGPHTHPGTLVATVESGEFGFTLVEEGEMELMRSGGAGTPAVGEPLTPGQEVVLRPGDWFVERGMVHRARNAGDEPVEIVFSGLIAAGQPLTTCVE